MAIVAGVAAVLGWAMSSPAGGVPDEPDHVLYAWAVVTGQAWGEGAELLSGYELRVRAPRELTQTLDPDCYARDPEVAVSDCNGRLGRPPSSQPSEISRMALYPPAYYALTGTVGRVLVHNEVTRAPGLSPNAIQTAMRMASGLAGLAVAAWGVLVLARRYDPLVVCAVLLVCTPPLAVSLMGAVNPNGMEVVAAFAMAAAVTAARRDIVATGRAGAFVWAGVVVSALLLGLVRPLSALWVVLILAVLLVPLPCSGAVAPGSRVHRPFRGHDAGRGRDRGRGRVMLRAVLVSGELAGRFWRTTPAGRAPWWGLAGGIVSLASSVGWLLWAGGRRFGNTPDYVVDNFEAAAPGTRAVLLLLKFGDMVLQTSGDLGWLGAPLPDLAVLCWLGATGTLALLWSLSPAARELPTRVVPLVLAAGLVAVLGHSWLTAFGWQGRYVLPLTAAVAVFAIPRLERGTADGVARRLVTWSALTAVGVHALAIGWVASIHAYGLRDVVGHLPQLPLGDGSSWVPYVGVSGEWLLSSVVLLGGAGAVLLLSGPRAADPVRTHLPVSPRESLDDPPDRRVRGEDPAGLLTRGGTARG